MTTILEEAKQHLDSQSEKGEREYNGTMDTAGYTPDECIVAAIEEAADMLVYLVALRRSITKGVVWPSPYK